jgi:hypothetical protein
MTTTLLTRRSALRGAAFSTAVAAIVVTHADAARAEAVAIAAFPAQSLANIAAKCAFAAKEKEDFELAVATVKTTAEDAERLAGKGGAA